MTGVQLTIHASQFSSYTSILNKSSTTSRHFPFWVSLKPLQEKQLAANQWNGVKRLSRFQAFPRCGGKTACLGNLHDALQRETALCILLRRRTPALETDASAIAEVRSTSCSSRIAKVHEVGQTSVAKRGLDRAPEEHAKAGGHLIREGRTGQGYA